MKNLVLFAGVMVAMCFASCGGNKTAEAPAEAEAVEAVEACCEAANDSCCAGDSCCGACNDSVMACCDSVKAE